MNVGIYGVVALFLQFVGGNLVHQSDAASFLAEVDDYTTTFFLNKLHGFVKLVSAVATHAAEDVSCHATAVHAHQDWLFGCPFALEHGNVLKPCALLTEGNDAEMAVCSGQIDFFSALYQ